MNDMRHAHRRVYCVPQDWSRHQRICRAPGWTEISPTIQPHLSRVDRFLREMIEHKAAVEHVEVVLPDEDRQDPRNGVVVWEADFPCPFGTPGRMVRWAVKSYTV